MRFLVDGSVLSELTRPAPSPKVVAWLREAEAETVVDAVILGEIRFGIPLLPKGRKRDALERWFDQGIDRLLCLPWDRAVAMRWAQLLAKLHTAGRQMPVKDSLIAASALAHGLTLVTRNRADFKHTGVKLLNPFE